MMSFCGLEGTPFVAIRFKMSSYVVWRCISTGDIALTTKTDRKGLLCEIHRIIVAGPSYRYQSTIVYLMG